jgi:hypothetical protein
MFVELTVGCHACPEVALVKFPGTKLCHCSFFLDDVGMLFCPHPLFTLPVTWINHTLYSGARNCKRIGYSLLEPFVTFVGKLSPISYESAAFHQTFVRRGADLVATIAPNSFPYLSFYVLVKSSLMFRLVAPAKLGVNDVSR